MHLLVVHKFGHRSGGHHGEGVKEIRGVSNIRIRRVDFEWYRLAILM